MSNTPIIISSDRVEVVLPASYELGEGSIWTGTSYLCVDIYGPSKFCNGPSVTSFNPYNNSEPHVYPMPSYTGTVVPVEGGKEVLVALYNGIHSLDLTTGTVRFLVNPETTPETRFNDGKASPEGRMWVGTMGEPGKVKPGVGGLFVIDQNRTGRRALDKITISNGMAWTADGKIMYYIDTPDGCVYAFDYDAQLGEISNRRVAFPIPAGTGHPDGCCIDAEGNLWVAQWGGSRVVGYRPADGSIFAEVHLPATNVSSCTFGGPDLGDMIITTAKEHLTPEERAAQPHAGNVFIVRNIGWKGVPACVFRG
jgi:sugar lactone lactonase YvrE